MRHLTCLIFGLTLFATLSCKNDTQRSEASSTISSNDIFFLICTDPIAHSYHRDYSSTGSYCNGLKRCIQRRYDVIRLPEDEAKSRRSDPCDFCYGH
ncbi:MAG: hypothetical protein IPO85_17070 [Saprospiraceae bacterium]|uniref:Lipoprotein n=1 Tax=Candidatus Defluviibacterium haderslevense TaxID=2981993 RepID=A0A9D7SAS4_9BACT|nr:hypothetical protein [Candidatus Defluviibacterium haderslevense]